MTVTVSNSQVDSFLQCEMRHWFAHIRKVQPKKYSDSLTRGIIGHEALAEYYLGVQMGDVAKGIRDMEAVIKHYMSDPDQDAVMLAHLLGLLNKYVEYYDPAEWRIIAVEKSYHLSFTDELAYGMRLDLLVQIMSGYDVSEFAIVDHKFVYDFKNADAMMLNAQLPKYLGTLQANGVPVRKAMLNQLRYRQTKNGLSGAEAFQRSMITPSAKEIKNILAEQIKVTERIAERESMSIEEAKFAAVRTINEITCKNCSFKYPCKTDLTGESMDLMLITEFEPNTYTGYTAASVASE